MVATLTILLLALWAIAIYLVIRRESRWTKCPQCKRLTNAAGAQLDPLPAGAELAASFRIQSCPSCARLNHLAQAKLRDSLIPRGYCVYCHDQLPSWDKAKYGACPECTTRSAPVPGAATPPKPPAPKPEPAADRAPISYQP